MEVKLKDEFLAVISSMLNEILSDDDTDIMPFIGVQDTLQKKSAKEITPKRKRVKGDLKNASFKVIKEARYLQKSRFEKFDEPVQEGDLPDNLKFCRKTLKSINGACLCPEHIDKLKMRDVSVVVIQKGGGPGLSDLDFKTHWRMTRSTVEIIYSLVNPPGSEAVVTPMELLAILWHFVTNDPFEHLESRFNIPKGKIQTLVSTVLERLCCCRSLLEVWPSSAAAQSVTNGFNNGGLPALGAVGCVHFQLFKAPFNPKNFINSLGNTTVIFQMVSDHRGSFTRNSYYFWPGKTDALTIYSASKLKKMPVPKDTFLVGGIGYAKSKDIIVPYGGSKLTQAEKEFNSRHEHCTKALQDAVLRLLTRFKILTILPSNQSSYIRQLVCACVIMHNLCVDLSDEVDIDTSLEAENFFPSPSVSSKQNDSPAFKKRDELCKSLHSTHHASILEERPVKKIRLDTEHIKLENRNVTVLQISDNREI